MNEHLGSSVVVLHRIKESKLEIRVSKKSDEIFSVTGISYTSLNP